MLCRTRAACNEALTTREMLWSHIQATSTNNQLMVPSWRLLCLCMWHSSPAGSTQSCCPQLVPLIHYHGTMRRARPTTLQDGPTIEKKGCQFQHRHTHRQTNQTCHCPAQMGAPFQLNGIMQGKTTFCNTLMWDGPIPSPQSGSCRP